MKLQGLLKSVLVFTTLTIPIVSNAIDTKIGGEMWGRWTYETAKFKNVQEDYVNKNSKNYLSLERGYFDLQTTFTPNTKARFTVDMFSSDATHEIPTDKIMPADSLKSSTIDGAGLKLKYAYVDFANLIPLPEMTVSAGLQKVYFGSIYDWTYALIGKAPTDEYKVTNSSDYGVTINGYLPNGFGEYAVGAYNGEGYKKVGTSLKDNTEYAYLANLRLTPIAGITLGGSYMANTVGREKALVGDVNNAAYEKHSLIDGIARLAYGPVDLWVEYISKDVQYPNATTKDYKAKGLMIMPTLSLGAYLPADIQLIGRYDTWDESDRLTSDKARSLLTATTIGVNYSFLKDATDVPQMQLQLNYTDKKYDEGKSNAVFADGMRDTSQLMLQLKWKYANTISN
jgi:hypothetical protein